MRGAPHRGLAVDISRINAQTSAGTPGRPVRCWLFHVQNRRKPRRCQASTVAGCTTWSAARQPGHRFDSHAHSRRSTVVKRSRGRRERFAIANWCRSARISKCRAAREQTNNRSEWRTETTTDTMDRAYSARLTISIVTRRTAFLVGTGCAEISLAVTGWARTRRVFRSEVVARPSVMTRG